MTFGIKVVLSWDLDTVESVGKDLVAHGSDLRGCFADFKGSSDLAHAWTGAAASAQSTAATTLATDLYDLSDMIGLIGAQIGRVAAELITYRNAIKKAVAQAREAEFLVADDGTVTVPPAKPGKVLNRAIVQDEMEEAATLASTLRTNLGLAATEDINLAQALAAAENTICHHATPAIVKEAVDFDAIPYLPGQAPNDPFLSDVVVGGPHAPTPGDPNFATYWQALTPLERQQAINSWNKLHPGFNPYASVKGGQLPAWAIAFNSTNNTSCSDPNVMVNPGYGYFGGGTVMGPDGKPWPIVTPYYSDGQHVYFTDGGATRDDGGINQLDGRDPGWHTVTSYTGVNQFGHIGTSTKVIVAGEVLGGQELETNPTDPGAVSIGPDGKPELGDTHDNRFEAPADKPYWDVDQPKEGEEYGPGEQIKAGASATIQTGQAIQAVHDVDSHGQREWQVQYQVNDDGRTRAIVNTYTSGPNEDGGGTNVGGFANSFPTGQHGTTSEVPIDTRYNPYTQPTMTQGTPHDVHYLGDPSRNGEILDNSKPIHEVLNK